MKIPPKLTHHYHWNKFNSCAKGYQNLQYRKSNIKETEILNIHIYRTTADIRVVKSRHKTSQLEQRRHIKMMHSYPHHTQELVIQHDKSLIDHPDDYYEKILQTERHNCYDVRYMSDSVQISNPFI